VTTASDTHSVGLVWMLFGLAGTAVFASRWIVQPLASRQNRRSTIPPLFWILSLLGSILLVAYFCLGPYRDVVGLLSQVGPTGIAIYNLLLIRRARLSSARDRATGESTLLGTPPMGGGRPLG
jgi:lipid-A-disaccharide synthase-like uncharacterized protein